MLDVMLDSENTKVEFANIGLNEETRAKTAHRLNILLADEHLLYVKTRNYHWNVTGLTFTGLHALFEQQYNQLQEMADEVAEHVRILGGHAIGTLSEFMNQARLRELPNEYLPAQRMLGMLLDDHSTLINFIRNDVKTVMEQGDESTADLLVSMMRKHEKMAWVLRSTLQGEQI